ncbi:MAG: Ig-like domain-containing protein, partial [Rhabdochlamydiaceae bacterium]
STSGQSVTLTATVSPSTATGTVTFTVDGTAQLPVTLSGGQATFSSSSLSVGSHIITAAYSGDTNDATSASSAVTQTVNKGSVAILLSSSVSSDTFGQPVTLTAIVSPVAPATSLPGGYVQFISNGQDLGSPVTLSNGKATLVITSLPAGTNYIVASYLGNSNFVPSSSNSVVVKITLTYLQQKTGVITSLTGLVQSDRDDKNNIDAAIKQVTESIKPSLWQADGLHLNTKNGEQVFDAEKHAVNQLMDTVKHHKESQAFDTTIEKNINTLVSVDQGISSTAISDASSGIPHGDSVKDLAQAQKEIVMAAGETSVGHFDAAIDHYKNAWKQAQEVLQDHTATVHH